MQTGLELFTLRSHNGTVHGIVFSPDGSRLVGGDDGGMVTFWNPTTGQELFSFRASAAGVISLAFSPDGRRVATASDDRTVRIWDASDRK